jgi:murein DD-endopeptidase MepM/ murein hydrolase activator NlpD
MAMGIYLMFNGQPLEGLIITVLYVAPIIWFSLVALDTVVVWAVFTAVSPFAWLAFIYPKTREYAMTAVKRMMSSGAKLAMISLLAVLMNCIVIDVVGTVSDLLNEKSEVAIKQADQAIKNAQAYQKVLGVQMTNNDTKPAVNRCIDVNEPTEFHLPFKNYDPQKNKVTSPLGWRTLFGKTSYHSGTDFGCREGEPLVAICSGQLVDPRAFKGFSLESLKNIVSRTLNYLGGYGYSAQLDCGNYGFLYAHMPEPPKVVDMGGKNNTDRTASPFDIPCQRENDALKQQNGELLCCVTAGQIIGKCGNTGRSTAPHLHLEYYGVKGAPELPVALGGIGLPKSDGCPEGKRRIPGSSGCMGIGGDDNKEKPSDGNNQQKNTPKNEKPKPQENPPKINPGGIVQPNKEIPEISSIKILDSGIKYVASKVNINQQESITLLQAVGQPTQDVLMAPGPTMLLNFQNILDKLVAQSPTQTTGENNPNNFTTETYGPDPAYPNHGKKHLHLGKTGFIEVVAMGILVLAAFGSGNKLVPESKGGFNLLTQFARITNFIGSLGDEKGKKEVVEGMKAAEQAKQEQEEQKEAEEERKQQEREQAEQQKATTEQQASTTLRKEGEEATSANTNNANNNNDNNPALRNEEYGGNNATENPQGRVATHSSTTNNQDTPQTGNKVNNIGVAAMVAAQGLGKGVLNATIINPVTKIKEDIGNEINKTKENIKNTARTITELPGNIVTSGKELGKTAWEMPGNIVESGKENLENLGKAAVEEWREIKQGASNIIQGTVTTITSIPDTIVRVSEEVAMGIINAPARAGNAIKENLETLRNIAVEELQKIKQGTVDKAVDTLINDWERTVNHVKLAWEMPGNTWENAKYNFDKTIHNIEQNIKNTTDIIVEVGKATWEMPGNIVEVGKEVGKAAWEMPGNIGNKLQEIKQTIISTPDNIVKKWNIAVTAVVATHTSITNKSVQEIREGVAKHTEQAIANAGKAVFGKEQDSDKNAGKNATPKEKTEEGKEEERKANIDNTIAKLNRDVIKQHEAGIRENNIVGFVVANVIGVEPVRKALAKGTKEAREELGLDLTKEEKLKIAGASCMRELSKYEKLRAEEEMRVIVANNEALRPHIEELNKQNNTNVDDYVSGLRKEQLEVSNEVTRLEGKTNRTQFEERELSKLKIKEQDLNKANAYLSEPNAREQFENYCKRKKEAEKLGYEIEKYNKTLKEYTKIKYEEPKQEQNASPNNNNDEGQNPSNATPSNLNNLQGSGGGNTQPHSLIPEETPEKKKEERKITIVKKKKVDKNDKGKNNDASSTKELVETTTRQSIEIIKKQ